jgi:SAM-dependent methyltransferase
MTFNLTPEQWKDIHAFQAQEIERIRSDKTFANEIARTKHFSCIGEWLTPGLGGRVLEAGCGPGRYVALLASLGFDVVGIDPYQHATWDVIRQNPHVELRDGVFAEDLPFPDASFDHVACIAALLYFRDPLLALREMRRVLKPGGRMLLRSNNRHNLYRIFRGRHLDPAASNYCTMRELSELARAAGFEIHHKFSYGFYPPIMEARWWHMVNGTISTRLQERISALTPPLVRMSLILFCTAAPSEREALPTAATTGAQALG